MFLTNSEDFPTLILYFYMLIAVITIVLLVYLIIKRVGEVDDFEHRDN